METEIYETACMSKSKSRKFVNWFNKEIGTEIEVNDNDTDSVYMVGYEMNNEEIDLCREFELNLEKED